MHQRREAGDPKYAKGSLIDGDHNDASLLARLKDKWRAYRKGNYSNIRLWGSVTIFFEDVKPLAIPFSKPIVVQIIFTCVPFIEKILKGVFIATSTYHPNFQIICCTMRVSE